MIQIEMTTTVKRTIVLDGESLDVFLATHMTGNEKPEELFNLVCEYCEIDPKEHNVGMELSELGDCDNHTAIFKDIIHYVGPIRGDNM